MLNYSLYLSVDTLRKPSKNSSFSFVLLWTVWISYEKSSMKPQKTHKSTLNHHLQSENTLCGFYYSFLHLWPSILRISLWLLSPLVPYVSICKRFISHAKKNMESSFNRINAGEQEHNLWKNRNYKKKKLKFRRQNNWNRKFFTTK